MAQNRGGLIQTTVDADTKCKLKKLAEWEGTTPADLTRQFITKGLREAEPTFEKMEHLQAYMVNTGLAEDIQKAREITAFVTKLINEPKVH